MSAHCGALTRLAWSALGSEVAGADQVIFTGMGALPSAFAVTDLAAAAIATAALSLAELIREVGAEPTVEVDRRLSSMWFRSSLRALGWEPPPLWDPIAGDYPARDGWIRLHTNASHHRAAAERVLGAQSDRHSTARAVAGWAKSDLERAVIEAGGCAAEMRSLEDWRQHPQGNAVAGEPLVHMGASEGAYAARPVAPDRPLRGVRVLDLTRVLAGPVASRFLAGYGAEILRIDSPDWDEPGIVPEVTLGKRCTRLDLRDPADRARFVQLLAQADILLHGYRPGALAGLGFDAAARRRLSPALIDVSLDAYGWSGPWSHRRGFDSLVQMSAGIADYGMRCAGAQQPVPLPVQALDHASGYLAAAAAIRGLTLRMRRGVGTEARLSLARTAQWLIDHCSEGEEPPLAQETDSDRAPQIELTDWGPGQRLWPPVRISGAPMQWDLPASALGSAPPLWCGE
jgi:hypothetical protein